MPRVVLNGNLRSVAGGRAEFDVEAKNVRQIFEALAKQCPALGPHLEQGVAVAIDGHIHQDAWFAEVRPDSDVHLMPAIAGG